MARHDAPRIPHPTCQCVNPLCFHTGHKSAAVCTKPATIKVTFSYQTVDLCRDCVNVLDHEYCPDYASGLIRYID